MYDRTGGVSFLALGGGHPGREVAEPWRRAVFCNWLIVIGLQKDVLLQTVFRRRSEAGRLFARCCQLGCYEREACFRVQSCHERG